MKFIAEASSGAPRQPAIVATPLLSTMMSRCRARERNWTVPSRRHISVRMVSPGKTGAEKRREMAVSLDGSYPQHDLRMACPATP